MDLFCFDCGVRIRFFVLLLGGCVCKGDAKMKVKIWHRWHSAVSFAVFFRSVCQVQSHVWCPNVKVEFNVTKFSINCCFVGAPLRSMIEGVFAFLCAFDVRIFLQLSACS